MKSFSSAVWRCARCSLSLPAPHRRLVLPRLPSLRSGSRRSRTSFPRDRSFRPCRKFPGFGGRRPGEVPASNLDTLDSKALDALSAAFTKAIQDKKFDDALRYFYSAQALGKTSLTGDWTEGIAAGSACRRRNTPPGMTSFPSFPGCGQFRPLSRRKPT